MTLIDQTQRIEATNPQTSFIVQAPAGSGKTEILTQRYLRLLSTVNTPEQIVALTFTRKAASEMRERILHALQRAACNEHVTSAHQQMTLNFAIEALQRSNQLGWNLLSQPNRMKINTIDSLCQSINQSIPLLEKHLSYAQITDKPGSHYLNAARQCVEFALTTPDYQHAIRTLLLHVDNRQDKLLELFTTLLAQRDQWLAPLFKARDQNKSTFEHALKHIETHGLLRLQQSLPFTIAHELVELTREMAQVENSPESPRYLLSSWTHFETLNQELAHALSALILKGDGGLRVAFDHYVGLKKGCCPDTDYTRIKQRSKELLSALNEFPEFLEALAQVSQLPTPEYDKEQWEVLQALFDLLPLLVGHLNLLFGELNEVDFTAISQSALAALGDEEDPTDLALYLDHSIHHLLVDEFQDTSITQFELLSQLVRGWQPGDGKTLFLVGDPMQSIYRFRQAEVGLFFRAREEGIGSVALKPLELSCNFRSTATIVNWVNQQFRHIFPAQVDIESGAVSFHPSVNVIDDSNQSAVYAFELPDREQEAEHLIQAIQCELAQSPERSLAILVRSRSHLRQIIKLLRRHHIPYQGSDIDLLSNLPHVRDIWSLTQALLYPANRLAWLAVLRSPFCGLPLADIHSIALFAPKKSIHYALQHIKDIKNIPLESQERATCFIEIMNRALTSRHHTYLSEWIVQTLDALNGDLILNQSQKEDLEQFYRLIDCYEEQGRISDSNSFLRELNNLYAKQTTPSRLQVMTIHKSKGLEFDTVFLPGLGSQPNRGDAPLLRWLKLPTQHQGTILLVSPIQAAHQERDALYDYLGRIDAEKSAYETQRLLYVAATRAKSRLYLLDSSRKSAKGSFKSMLKTQQFSPLGEEKIEEQTIYPIPELIQLPLTHYKNTIHLNSYAPITNQPGSVLSINTQRLTGIVAHQLLQWICDNRIKEAQNIPWSLAEYELTRLGFAGDTLITALSGLKKQIELLFEDKTGQWIIAPHHNEHNEYELLIEHQGKLATRIIDRTFEDNDQLWIIDFKTGKETKETLSKHQLQLNDYAYYCSMRTSLTVRCGLYYLENGHFVTWVYSLELEN